METIEGLKDERDEFKKNVDSLSRLAAEIREIIFHDADTDTQTEMIGSPNDVLIFARHRLVDLKNEVARLKAKPGEKLKEWKFNEQQEPQSLTAVACREN